MKEYVHKIPGGKLLRIKIEVRGDIIKKITILGDFFLYPEEKILSIEKSLTGAHKKDVSLIVQNIIQNERIKLLGIDENSLVKLILNAFDDRVT